MSNIKIVRARSSEEYVSMIEQALDDVWDLHQSIEFDEDFMADAREFIGPLENSLKDLYQSMKDGNYQFATGDLPFMEIVEKYHDAQLPFKFLLKRINETHLKGLEV
ncbi:MAG: hypothetical protein WBO73_12020 [Gammaproteobacteria bacterium]